MSIKLSGLPQFKNQRLLMLVLAGISVVALFVFVSLMPLRSKKIRLYNTFKELESKNQNAERLIVQEKDIRDKAQTIEDQISLINNQYLPPEDNTLLWVTEQIYNYARNAGVEVELITEIKIPTPPWKAKKRTANQSKEQRLFSPYAIEVITECNYEQVLKMVKAMEAENPYVSLSTLSINAQVRNPDYHKVRMVLQWPKRDKSETPEPRGKRIPKPEKPS